MSFHRENVIWKSRNDTWSMGVFDCYQTGDDPEWDVEYDFNTFSWASSGHASQQAAYQAWRDDGGSNTGGGEVHDTPSSQTDQWDAMVANYNRTQRAGNGKFGF